MIGWAKSTVRISSSAELICGRKQIINVTIFHCEWSRWNRGISVVVKIKETILCVAVPRDVI